MNNYYYIKIPIRIIPIYSGDKEYNHYQNIQYHLLSLTTKIY